MEWDLGVSGGGIEWGWRRYGVGSGGEWRRYGVWSGGEWRKYGVGSEGGWRSMEWGLEVGGEVWSEATVREITIHLLVCNVHAVQVYESGSHVSCHPQHQPALFHSSCLRPLT